MRLALFGGSFNPPGLHHRQIAETLARHFDEVIVIPCGPRPDKPITNDVEPIHRAALADLTFARLARTDSGMRVTAAACGHSAHARAEFRDQLVAVLGLPQLVQGERLADAVDDERHCRAEQQNVGLLSGHGILLHYIVG